MGLFVKIYSIGNFSLPEDFRVNESVRANKDREAVFLTYRKFLTPRRIAKRFFERVSEGNSFLVLPGQHIKKFRVIRPFFTCVSNRRARMLV